METLSKRSPLVVVEAALSILSVVSLLMALFWVVGGHGLGLVYGDRTPDSFLAAQAVPTVEVVSRWLVARWLLATSTAGDLAEIPPVKIAIWPVAVAAVLVVLAIAGLEGGRMRRELEGLV
jgi:hypothetical protein